MQFSQRQPDVNVLAAFWLPALLVLSWQVVGAAKVQKPHPGVSWQNPQHSAAVLASCSDRSCPAKSVFAKTLQTGPALPDAATTGSSAVSSVDEKSIKNIN